MYNLQHIHLTNIYTYLKVKLVASIILEEKTELIYYFQVKELCSRDYLKSYAKVTIIQTSFNKDRHDCMIEGCLQITAPSL